MQQSAFLQGSMHFDSLIDGLSALKHSLKEQQLMLEKMVIFMRHGHDHCHWPG